MVRVERTPSAIIMFAISSLQEGVTPLTCAASGRSESDTECCKILLGNGADVNKGGEVRHMTEQARAMK